MNEELCEALADLPTGSAGIKTPLTRVHLTTHLPPSIYTLYIPLTSTGGPITTTQRGIIRGAAANPGGASYAHAY